MKECFSKRLDFSAKDTTTEAVKALRDSKALGAIGEGASKATSAIGDGVKSSTKYTGDAAIAAAKKMEILGKSTWSGVGEWAAGKERKKGRRKTTKRRKKDTRRKSKIYSRKYEKI